LHLPGPGQDSCEEREDCEGYEFSLPALVLVGGASMAAGEMVTAMELRVRVQQARTRKEVPDLVLMGHPCGGDGDGHGV